jgi:flagellar M-ring protein FliF
VDSKGELLSKPGDDSMMSLSSTQMEYRQSFENNLSTKILGILEPVVGTGRIKAKVSSEFDFTRSERTEEIYDPDGVVVRSEQKSTEKSSSGGGTRGIPGTESNLPGGASAGASVSDPGKNYSRYPY